MQVRYPCKYTPFYNNIFIEMTAKNCNYRCKNCHIDFGVNNSINAFHKTIKDFNGEIVSKMKMIETHQYDDPDYYYISFSDTIAEEYFIKTLDLMI